ncbi:MAG TPA: hypothetical protein VL547_01490 [Dinghuibacter sp.]|jgi:hypothetical protein|uniref:hypothetical protein n=1 Tax=Dinghuibacter sp. TaxID=2024697 RepID=UPI002CD4FD30|nr:hypothetical protein [Dinghuibacter sp.]HTJ10661.1 hypothetical protein [Dinghuibacter sp.]
MSQEHATAEVIETKQKDFAYSWPSSSRFLFYVNVAVILGLFLAMCYGLYVHRYQGKPEVEVPGNTLYNPVYK